MAALNTVELKAYEEKVTAQIEQAKGKLHELEGYFKGKKADTELEVLRGLRTTQKDIERKTSELKTIADAKVTQVKAEIDSTLATFNNKLAQLAGKAHQKVG